MAILNTSQFPVKYTATNSVGKNFLGNISENFVSRILQIAGFTIITRNFNLNFTEIDIVAVKGKKLYIIEVRARECKSLVNTGNVLSGNTDIWWKHELESYIDIRKILRILNGSFWIFNFYRESLKIKTFLTYLVLICWKNGRLYRIKFINFLDLI